MSTLERMFLFIWKQSSLFVLLSPADLQQAATRLAQRENLIEAEVLACLTRVYNTWYEEALAECKGNLELLQGVSKLHAMENSKGILRWV